MTLVAVAHRAGNSLAGLRTAVDLGADVVEADVNLYRGRLEVHHLKTMGPLPFLWDRWELRSVHAPRLGLAELFAAAHEGVTFMLDLKGADVGAPVAEALHAAAPGRPVIVCTRKWASLAPFAGIDWVRPVRSARTRAEFAALLTGLEAGAFTPYGVSVHLSLLDEATVARLHRTVEMVMTWPVNTPAALERVRRFGVSGTVGVISDEAAILRRLLAQRNAP